MKTFIKKNFFKLSSLILLILVISLYIKNSSPQGDKLNNIVFGWPGTTFTDSGDIEDNPDFGSIYVEGSLTGENLEKLLNTGTMIGKTNNTVMISCYRQKKECTTYTMTQYGENQVSDLPEPSIIPIVSWGKDLIVASDFDPVDTWSCSKVTINIDRKSQTTEWVQEPNNQDKTSCKDSYGSTYKWGIKKPGL